MLKHINGGFVDDQGRETDPVGDAGDRVMADVLRWLRDNSSHNRFAASVNAYYDRNGYLTPGHLRAIEKILSNKPASVAGEGFNLLQRSFEHARKSGLKSPKVHIGPFRFWPAKEDSVNPGFLYVKENGEYKGKFSPAGLFSSRDASAETIQRITEIAKDPFNHAMRHGHMTGNCAICSKRLTDSESVTRGIGPVCAKRFGWI